MGESHTARASVSGAALVVLCCALHGCHLSHGRAEPSDGPGRADAGSADAGSCVEPCEPSAWVRAFAAESPTATRRVAHDGEGNAYIVGSGGLVSYAPDGRRRWGRHLGGVHATQLAVTRAGDVFVAAEYEGAADVGGGPLTSPPGRTSLVVARFTSDGAHRWSRSFGGDTLHGEVDLRLAADADGVYLGGLFSGTLDFGGAPLVAAPFEYTSFLASLDPEGGFRWARTLGRTELGHDPLVGVDGRGHVYVSGYHPDAVDLGGGPLEPESAHLASFTTAGVHRWSRDLEESVDALEVADHGALFVASGETVRRLSADGVDGATLTLPDTVVDVAVDAAGALYVAGVAHVARYDADGTERWTRRFSVADPVGARIRVRDIDVDDAGNVSTLADFQGAADFGGEPLTGGRRAFLRHDRDGALRWQRRSGVLWWRGLSAAADASGNVYVAGTFSAELDLGGGPWVGTDDGELFLASFGPTGAHRWSRRFGGVGSFYAVHHIAFDAEGHVYLTGLFAGAPDFGGGPLETSSSAVYAASFTADGAHRWSRALGAVSRGRGVGAAVDPGGDLLLVRPTFDGTTLERFAPDGTLLWARPIDPVSLDRGPPSLAIDGRGDVYMTAIVHAGGFDWDVVVRAYDADGELRWNRRVATTDDEPGASLAALPSGGACLAGHWRRSLSIGSPRPPPASALLTCFDADGERTWSRELEGVGGAGNGPSVAVGPDGDVYLAANYVGPLRIGETALPTPALSDGLVARFTSDGTLRRARVFRTAVGSSLPSACAVGPDGVFVAGFFAGTTDFAGTPRSSESWSDLFIGHFR